MVPSGVGASAPAAYGGVGALEGVVAKLLTVGALGVLVEAEVALQPVGGRKGRKARQGGKVLSPGAGDSDDDSGDALLGATVVRGKPPGLLRKRQARVVGGKFPTNIGEGVRGGDAVHKKLRRGVVQLDGGSAGDEVEELGDLAAKRGCLHRVHGDKGEVTRRAGDNTLNKGSFQGRVDAVPDGDNGGGKGAAVSLDDEAALAVGKALLGRGRSLGGWRG
jgi:hypothetical protein